MRKYLLSLAILAFGGAVAEAGPFRRSACQSCSSAQTASASKTERAYLFPRLHGKTPAVTACHDGAAPRGLTERAVSWTGQRVEAVGQTLQRCAGGICPAR